MPVSAPSEAAHVRPLDVAADLLALLHDTNTEPRADTQLEALTLAVSADLPVLLWGEPGIGKTAALNQLADALELPLTTVIASVHEPSDFSGLPVVGDDPATQGVPMAPPDWAVRLVRAGHGLLFLDELSTAPPAVQAALLRVVLERRVGALQLPQDVRIVAAANPRSSAADGWELSPPLANRFVHLQWTYDHEVVVRGLGGTWPKTALPRLDSGQLPDAVTFARRAVCELLAARPGLVHQLPKNEARRGGPWPSVLDGVVEAVRRRPEQSRWNAAWSLLVLALETGAPDLVVVPAATLAALRRDDWQVPAAIERLAGAVSLSQRADRVAVGA